MAAKPTSEDPRLWHPSAAFDLCAHRPYFGDEAWGACFANHVYGLPATVHAHARITPEGLLLHADCDRCSARDEVVLDFRAVEGEPDLLAVELASFGSERVRELQLSLGQEPLRAWADAHRDCLPPAHTPDLPRPVVAALEQLETYKAAELRERGCAEPSVVAVLADRGPVWFELEAADEAERMLTGFRVREATLDFSRPALAVLAAEEVLVGRQGSVLRFAVLMEGGNWLGEAAIDRFDRPYPGRGVLQPVAWTPIRETATWLDGLRARRQPHPLPRVLPEVNR